MENFDWTKIVEFLIGLAPWMNYVIMGLGILVVVATFIDSMIDDSKDKGFMKFVLNIPVLGSFLSFLTRFSPFNFVPKK